jgi:hypothetical protein
MEIKEVNEYMTVINWGEKQMLMPPNSIEMRPTQIHLKTNGAKSGGASIAIVMQFPGIDNFILGQMSIDTLTKVMNELGYQLTKIDQ